jgi:hypothetical protein
MAIAVATAFIAASSILLSAAQMGSPTVSGYGVNASVDGGLTLTRLAVINP